MAAQPFVELATVASNRIQTLPLAQQVTAPKKPSSTHDSRTQVEDSEAIRDRPLSTGRATAIIIQLSGLSFLTCFSNGLITLGLPVIAKDLRIHDDLLVWPLSVSSLASGSCLLLAGSFVDIVGPRICNLVGSFILTGSMIACGLSRNGIELIIFRAVHGVACALTVPSSVSIISTSIPSGRPRNIGFGSLGLAQPLGFSAGMILGGVLISNVGWPSAFYVGGGLCFLLSLVGIWALPKTVKSTESSTMTRLAREPDWIGACLASASIALLSYVLAMLSADITNIKKASNITLLVVSLMLVPAFVWWMDRREKQSKSALIPNSMWRKRTFTTLCIMIMTSWASMNCMELLSSLFFQKVQGLSTLDASVRILPNIILGTAINLLVGVFVDRVPILTVVLVSSGLCACAPLLLAVIHPDWSYWYDAFFVQLLTPLSADVLFTIGMLIVSDVFPVRTQAMAGAVFNTLAQLGTSIGLTSTAVLSISITRKSADTDRISTRALMDGYRASSWMLFALMIISCSTGVFGLRKLGAVGQKRD